GATNYELIANGLHKEGQYFSIGIDVVEKLFWIDSCMGVFECKKVRIDYQNKFKNGQGLFDFLLRTRVG
ncbi:MAG: hypothetical protein RLZZ506_1331, partial [Bacteroidota bacterium]